MLGVSVSQLKARLSHYLRTVRRGGEVEICDRGEPVARLVGIDTRPRTDNKLRIESLIREGVLRRGEGNFSWLLSRAPVAAADVDLRKAIDEDREDRV